MRLLRPFWSLVSEDDLSFPATFRMGSPRRSTGRDWGSSSFRWGEVSAIDIKGSVLAGQGIGAAVPCFMFTLFPYPPMGPVVNCMLCCGCSKLVSDSSSVVSGAFSGPLVPDGPDDIHPGAAKADTALDERAPSDPPVEDAMAT